MSPGPEADYLHLVSNLQISKAVRLLTNLSSLLPHEPIFSVQYSTAEPSVQCDLGGKVNIFGGSSIGRCEIKYILTRIVTEIEMWECTSTKTL